MLEIADYENLKKMRNLTHVGIHLSYLAILKSAIRILNRKYEHEFIDVSVSHIFS